MESKKGFYLLFLLSGVGFATAVYLSHHHYALTFGETLSFQLCQKGCDTVNTSSYSELWGIPIASYGAVAYGAILIMAFLGLLFVRTTLKFFLFSVIFLVSLLCLAGSFVLAAISILKLGTFCKLCGVTYLVNALMVGVSGWKLKASSGAIFKTMMKALGDVLKKQDPRQNPVGYFQKIILSLATLIFFLSITSGLAISYFHSSKYQVLGKDKLDKYLENYAKLPRVTPRTEGSPAKGSRQSKLTLVDFSDFACSHCRNAFFVLKRLLPEYRKDMQIVYKHWPHDKTCNPYSQATSAYKSCQLAKASICAQKQGKFWEYHDLLFAPDKPPTTKSKLVSLARQAGIDPSDFETCLAHPATQAVLLKDIEEGNRFGVKSTPTFFLNGKMVRLLPPSPLLHTLIQLEIREHSRR